jgi:hypothetical protein
VDDTGAGMPNIDLHRVQIFSEPSHANVVDARTGKLLGTTPFFLPVPRGETLVSVRKRGYHAKELIVNGDEQTASVVLERNKSGAEPRPTDDSTADDDQRKL